MARYFWKTCENMGNFNVPADGPTGSERAELWRCTFSAIPVQQPRVGSGAVGFSSKGSFEKSNDLFWIRTQLYFLSCVRQGGRRASSGDWLRDRLRQLSCRSR